MSTPNIGVQSGTPNTGTENSSLFTRDVDPRLYFFKTPQHPFASLLMSKGMNLVYRDNAPTPTITGKPKSRSARDMKVEWFEDAQYQLEYNPTVEVAASDTSVTVGTTYDDYFRAGDVVMLTNAAGQREEVRVASVGSGVLNVTNIDGTTRTAGITMTTSDEFYLFQNSRAEDSTAPAIRTTKSAEMYNYLEVISEPYGLTKIKQATSHYTGDQMQLEKRKAFTRLMERYEAALLFGTRAIQNASTNPIRQTGGLFYFMELYSDVEIRDLAGITLTQAELNAFLTVALRNGSSEKVLLCDSIILSAINSFGYEYVQTPNFRVPELGMNVMEIFGPFGKIKVAHEPLFDSVRSFNGTAVVIDMDNVTHRFLSGNGVNMDFHDEAIILADGSISQKGQYIGAVGPEYTTLKHFAWLKNVGQ